MSTKVIPEAIIPRSEIWRPTFSRLRTTKKLFVVTERRTHITTNAKNTPVSRAPTNDRRRFPHLTVGTAGLTIASGIMPADLSSRLLVQFHRRGLSNVRLAGGLVVSPAR